MAVDPGMNDLKADQIFFWQTYRESLDAGLRLLISRSRYPDSVQI